MKKICKFAICVAILMVCAHHAILDGVRAKTVWERLYDTLFGCGVGAGVGLGLGLLIGGGIGVVMLGGGFGIGFVAVLGLGTVLGGLGGAGVGSVFEILSNPSGFVVDSGIIWRDLLFGAALAAGVSHFAVNSAFAVINKLTTSESPQLIGT